MCVYVIPVDSLAKLSLTTVEFVYFRSKSDYFVSLSPPADSGNPFPSGSNAQISGWSHTSGMKRGEKSKSLPVHRRGCVLLR